MKDNDILFISDDDEPSSTTLPARRERSAHEMAHAAFMKWPGSFSPPLPGDFGAECPHCYPYQRQIARAREQEIARESEQRQRLSEGNQLSLQLVPAGIGLVADTGEMTPSTPEVLYTTVQKNGKTMVVPYNPGQFELLRAVELIVSGTSVTAALGLLTSGHPLVAAGLGVVAAFEFVCGMRRWPQAGSQPARTHS